MHPFTAAELATEHQRELRDTAAAYHRTATARRGWWSSRRRSQPAPPPVAEGADLAERLASFGPGTLTIELHRFARDALRRGACPLLVSVVADATQPDVARLRAFGRIMADLQRPASAAAPSRSDAA